METAADEYQKEKENPDAVGLEESRKEARNVDFPQTKLNLDATKEYAVIVDDVVKVFGEEQVLKHVSHAFERGKVHGIIGNNGSGKTVMLKCICGFMKPTTGRVLVHGKEIGKDVDFPDDIGIIIESPGFLPTKTGFRNLQILASLKGKIGREEIIRTIERVGLDPALKKPVSKYSLGMRQRLGIAQAIMEDPDLLILDEPFNGLDRYGVEDIRKIIQDLKELNKTILLVSHNGEDIRLLCDTVCEMDAGILREVYHDEEE
ncbi:MAG: ATP-binding cassette domain-containing protein [Lachnospiraceae bacterium]|nr:ATP-binding cassette domain-containing protein [Lachnospiraceae bacterium]